jgi:hypothetical protein
MGWIGSVLVEVWRCGHRRMMIYDVFILRRIGFEHDSSLGSFSPERTWL